MLAFSFAYVGAGWLLLGVWGLGAEGLVGANAVNMGVRIFWCKIWVEVWWRAQKDGSEGEGEEEGEKEVVDEKGRGETEREGKNGEVPVFKVLSAETLPKMRTAGVGVAAWAVLSVLRREFLDGGLLELVVLGGVAGLAGVTMRVASFFCLSV